jgi:hypothetical protein
LFFDTECDDTALGQACRLPKRTVACGTAEETLKEPCRERYIITMNHMIEPEDPW